MPLWGYSDVKFKKEVLHNLIWLYTEITVLWNLAKSIELNNMNTALGAFLYYCYPFTLSYGALG